MAQIIYGQCTYIRLILGVKFPAKTVSGNVFFCYKNSSKEGFNNNPTLVGNSVKSCAYKALQVHVEIKSNTSADFLAQDSRSILKISSLKKIQKLKTKMFYLIRNVQLVVNTFQKMRTNYCSIVSIGTKPYLTSIGQIFTEKSLDLLSEAQSRGEGYLNTINVSFNRPIFHNGFLFLLLSNELINYNTFPNFISCVFI